MKNHPKIIAMLGGAQTVTDLALRKTLKLKHPSDLVIILDYTGRGAMMLGDTNKMGLLHHAVTWYDLANRQRPAALFAVSESGHLRMIITRALRLIREVAQNTLSDATIEWAAAAASRLSQNSMVTLNALYKSLASTDVRRWFLDAPNHPNDLSNLLEMLAWALRFPSVYAISEGTNQINLKQVLESTTFLWVEMLTEHFERHEYYLAAGLMEIAIEDAVRSFKEPQANSLKNRSVCITHLFPPFAHAAVIPVWIKETSDAVRHTGVFSLYGDKSLHPSQLSWIQESSEVWIAGKTQTLQAAAHHHWLTEHEISHINKLDAGNLWIRANKVNQFIVAKTRTMKAMISDGHQLRRNTTLRFHPSSVMQMSSAMPPEQKPRVRDNLYQQLCDIEFLRLGWSKIHSNNKKSHGCDQITIPMFKENLENELAQLQKELVTHNYHCRPLRRCNIKKPDGGIRELGIACIRDRVVQSACLMLIEPVFEPLFSRYSFAFRPHRTTHQAIAMARSYISKGFEWVVCADIHKCFDNIDHDVLMDKLAERVGDQEILKLIRHWLEVDVLHFRDAIPPLAGVPQGASLSPLLANIYLDSLDKHFEGLDRRYIRYADDIILLTQTEDQAREGLQILENYLIQPLQLRLKPAKTHLTHASEGFDYLGFHITNNAIEIRQNKIDSVQELVRRQIVILGNAASNMENRVEAMLRINAVARGYRNYFLLSGESRIIEQMRFLDGQVEMMGNFYLPPAIKDDPAWICRERFCLAASIEDIETLVETEERNASTSTGYPNHHDQGHPGGWLVKNESMQDFGEQKPSMVVEDQSDETEDNSKYHGTYIENGDRLYVLTHGCYLTAQDSDLVIKKNKEEIYRRPLGELGLLFLQGFGMNISISLQLKLAEMDVPVVFAPRTGAPLAVLNPVHSTKSSLRCQQVLRRNDPDVVTAGLHMIAAKVGNQAAVLKYFSKYRKKTNLEMGWRLMESAEKLIKIKEVIRHLGVDHPEIRTVARGYEGQAAAMYWNQILAFVPEAMEFSGRMTHSAKDVFNQCLNYAYGILYGEVWRAIVKAGLDPYFGLIHGAKRNQGSLVFDLIEEFRAPFADRLVIGMFGRNFQPEIGTHGFLKTRTRKQLAIGFSKKWQKKFNWRSREWTPAGILEAQAVSLANLFNRKGNYQPYRMRW